MKIFLSHNSALEVLRGIGSPSVDAGWAKTVRTCNATSLEDATANAKALRSSGLMQGERTLHVLVSDRKHCRSIDNVATHVHNGTFPRGPFLQCGNGIYVSGPELTLTQLACTRDQLELICVAAEMTGGYSLGAMAAQKPGVRGSGVFLRKPLTTVEAIERFTDQMSGARGTSTLRKALAFVPENAWSPMECSLALLLCLPERMGGFGLPRPLLNHRIVLSSEGRSIAGRKACYCDLYWPDASVAVEYDGVETHAHSYERDDSKQLALEHMGVRVFRSTISQFKDPVSSETLAGLIRECLCERKRRPKTRSDVELTKRRAELTARLTRQFQASAYTSVVGHYTDLRHVGAGRSPPTVSGAPGTRRP